MATFLYTNKFKEIYRKTEYANPTNELIDFPLLIDIELTNNCNMKCRMCATQQMQRRRGYMSPRIFYEAMNQAKEYGAKGIRLIRFGEPFMHRDVFRFIRAMSKENLLTHLTTNGKLLYLAIDSIVNSRLNTLIISLQGYDRETYQNIRIGGNYEHLKKILGILMRQRKVGPFIQLTTTINKGEEKNIGQLEKEWTGLCDELTWGYTRTKHLKNSKLIDNKLPMREDCPEPWRKLSINWNGDVTLCCLDYDGFLKIGNIEDMNLYELWHSDKANKIRKDLTMDIKSVEGYKLCKVCELSHEFEKMK